MNLGKPTSIAELKAYLTAHPWICDSSDHSSRPVKSAYITKNRMLHFRGTLSFWTLGIARFDETGFSLLNFWDDWVRFEYRDNNGENNGDQRR